MWILDKITKDTPQRRTIFSTQYQENLPGTIFQNQLKINVRPKTVNRGRHEGSHDTGSNSDFLDMMLKHRKQQRPQNKQSERKLKKKVQQKFM